MLRLDDSDTTDRSRYAWASTARLLCSDTGRSVQEKLDAFVRSRMGKVSRGQAIFLLENIQMLRMLGIVRILVISPLLFIDTISIAEEPPPCDMEKFEFGERFVYSFPFGTDDHLLTETRVTLDLERTADNLAILSRRDHTFLIDLFNKIDRQVDLMDRTLPKDPWSSPPFPLGRSKLPRQHLAFMW